MIECNCSDKMSMIIRKIEFISGERINFNTIDRLKKCGFLDKLMFKEEYHYYLKRQLTKFLDVLFNDKCHAFEKRIWLNSNFPKDLNDKISNYIISLYCGNKSIYKDNSKIILLLIDKLNIFKYKDKSLQDIRNSLIYSMDYEINKDKNSINILNNKNYILDDYNKIIEKIKNKDINLDDYGQLLLFLKFLTYQKEENDIFVSKIYGENYGFDILSYKGSKENAITVKYIKDGRIILDSAEYKALIISQTLNNSDYYIYKYDNDRNLFKLKFDKERKLFVDENNNEYTIEEFYSSNYKINAFVEKKVKKYDYSNIRSNRCWED